MKFNSIQHIKEEYTKARLQGYNKNIVQFAYEHPFKIGRRCEYCEHFILMEPLASVDYASLFLKKRWKKAENIIATDARASFVYAKCILQRRFKKGEKVIKTDPIFYQKYKKTFKIKDRELKIFGMIIVNGRQT